MASAELVRRILAKLAALDVLPAEEAASRNEDEHQRNIREYYGLYLNPKATHAEVEEFERRHRIRLPADYRDFVTRIGNGGCGPGNVHEGLYPFQRSAGPGWSRYSLGRPFPLTKPPAGLERWPPVLVSEETVKQLRNGLLLLSHYGCGLLACLVVCGERYGEVWIDDFANGGLIFPAQDSWVVSPPTSGGGPSFSDWYEGGSTNSWRGGAWGNQAPQQTAGHDSFPATVAHRCPAGDEPCHSTAEVGRCLSPSTMTDGFCWTRRSWPKPAFARRTNPCCLNCGGTSRNPRGSRK